MKYAWETAGQETIHLNILAWMSGCKGAVMFGGRKCQLYIVAFRGGISTRWAVQQEKHSPTVHLGIEMPDSLSKSWPVLTRNLVIELHKLNLLGVCFARCSRLVRLVYDNDFHLLGAKHVVAHCDCNTILIWLLSVSLDRWQCLVWM